MSLNPPPTPSTIVGREDMFSSEGDRPQQQQSYKLVVDQLIEMRRQERSWYRVPNYYQPPSDTSLPDLGANSSWRQKICHWSYSVVDHFCLSREVVAISLSIFDRYMATRGNRSDSSTALLVSLTALHIAIKLNETKKIKLSTLAGLSRGQFHTHKLEAMEWSILSSLSWLVHPPTAVSFISYLLLLFPSYLDPSISDDFFELSRYQAELSVCDPFFVDHDPSIVAFASILNVMEDVGSTALAPTTRERFLQDVTEYVKLYHYDPAVKCAQQRLRSVFATSLGHEDLDGSLGISSGQTVSFHSLFESSSRKSSQENSIHESKSKDSSDNHSEGGSQTTSSDHSGQAPKGYRGGRRTVNPM